MNTHYYSLVTLTGDVVMHIRSAPTNLDFDAYAAKFIVPMLPALSSAEGEKVQYTR